MPLDLSDVLSDPKVGAVVYSGQPSVQTLGVSDVIFGRVSPAGRLVQTLYPESVQHQISIFDMNMRPGPSLFPRPDQAGCRPGNKSVPCSDGTSNGRCTPDVHCEPGTNPGRTHRFFTGKPVMPFGFGLSYTTFSYALNSVPAPVIDLNPVRKLLTNAAAAGRTFLALEDTAAADLRVACMCSYCSERPCELRIPGGCMSHADKIFAFRRS